MKKLLSDFLGIKESDIESYSCVSEHFLSIETETDFGRPYPIISGDICTPQYRVIIKLTQDIKYVQLEELLVFIYESKLK